MTFDHKLVSFFKEYFFLYLILDDEENMISIARGIFCSYCLFQSWINLYNSSFGCINESFKEINRLKCLFKNNFMYLDVFIYPFSPSSITKSKNNFFVFIMFQGEFYARMTFVKIYSKISLHTFLLQIENVSLTYHFWKGVSMMHSRLW